MNDELKIAIRKAAYEIAFNTDNASKILKGPRFMWEEYIKEVEDTITKYLEPILSYETKSGS